MTTETTKKGCETETRPCVYELRDAFGGFLYVGATAAITIRLSSHRRRHWGARIQSVSITFYGTMSEALDVEARLIAEHRPEFNREGVTRYRRDLRGWVLHTLRSGPASQTELEKRARLTRGWDDGNQWVGTILGRLLTDGHVEVVDERDSVSGRHATARIFALVKASSEAAA